LNPWVPLLAVGGVATTSVALAVPPLTVLAGIPVASVQVPLLDPMEKNVQPAGAAVPAVPMLSKFSL